MAGKQLQSRGFFSYQDNAFVGAEKSTFRQVGALWTAKTYGEKNFLFQLKLGMHQLNY